MNSASTPSQIRRYATTALAFAGLLLSVGCSTATSASKNDADKPDPYAAYYGELHGIMAKLAVDTEQKNAAQPAASTANIASNLDSSGALASNP